ncbi:MAG: hypothetical protein Q8O17_05580 [Candidatus Methanoperedens sp.]|nr:hypothetical protein [Candidatus Methanoperedens sp.]
MRIHMGYASLGIEQRNRGGVDMNYDYKLFSEEMRKPLEDELRSMFK